MTTPGPIRKLAARLCGRRTRLWIAASRARSVDVAGSGEEGIDVATRLTMCCPRPPCGERADVVSEGAKPGELPHFADCGFLF